MLNLNEMMDKQKEMYMYTVTKNKTILYLYEMPFIIDEN